ncbi:MAG: phosphate signaling complex protein PhoU [Burkholderiaceae bacterium]|jgi:phosphate transport system protein|nr:phosphate signaling complex protein PhoU [Burkholderiaceae bacterium]
MSDKHLSSQFDSELAHLSSHLLAMGGLVEAQLRQALAALTGQSDEIAEAVLAGESRVNAMEVALDDELTRIIARRQPAAVDLRLLLSISRVTANLERAGDEAAKIARMVRSIIDAGPHPLPLADLRLGCDLAAAMIAQSLDAFARLDTAAAIATLKQDAAVDREFDGFVRKLVTYMMEDPRMISQSLDLLFIAKAIERIGDHAKNIAECVIYVVKGADVRHRSLAETEAQISDAAETGAHTL